MFKRARSLATGFLGGLLAIGSVLAAQSITIPNTFVNGTTADATQVNANFAALAAAALNRAAGVFTGDANPDADDTRSLGTNVLRFANVRAHHFNGTGADFTGTHIGDGAAVTNLAATNLATGTVPTARLGTGVADATTYLRGDSTWATTVVATPLTFDDTQAATGANTTETILYTYTAPAGLLATNGKTIRLKAAGTFAANANTKTIRVRWNGIAGTVAATMSLASSGFTYWTMDALVSRIASNSQRLWGKAVNMRDSDGYPGGFGSTLTTAAVTDSGAITLVVTGQNGTATASDIVFESAWVEVF